MPKRFSRLGTHGFGCQYRIVRIHDDQLVDVGALRQHTCDVIRDRQRSFDVVCDQNGGHTQLAGETVDQFVNHRELFQDAFLLRAFDRFRSGVVARGRDERLVSERRRT